jgi:tRNA pseudouridine-54 N-methylase
VFLDSPATNELTKTELDIGVVSRPYVEVAHCIRASFCVSHALREWVRITIGFDEIGPYTLTLDPTTIRYMGTDERSILHIVLRAQESQRRRKAKVPYGVSIAQRFLEDSITSFLDAETTLLIPSQTENWKEKQTELSKLAMYCPLFEDRDPSKFQTDLLLSYSRKIPRDIAILELVHALDD